MNSGFDRLLARYFEGDLDPVERLRFEHALDQPENQRTFDEAWDARTDALGLAALVPVDPTRAGSFSEATLHAYTRGRLTPEEAQLVETRLAYYDDRDGPPQPVAAPEEPPQEDAPPPPGSDSAPPPPPAEPAAESPSPAATPFPFSVPRVSREQGWGLVAAGLAAVALLSMAVSGAFSADAPVMVEALRPSMTLAFVANEATQRHEDAREPGDRLDLRVDGLEGRQGVLRVYLQGRGVVAECPGHEGCESVGDGYRLQLTLERKGLWRAAWLVSEGRPIPGSTGDLQSDLEAMRLQDLELERDFKMATERWEVR